MTSNDPPSDHLDRGSDPEKAAHALLVSLKNHHGALRELLEHVDSRYEDGLYRYYHHSFKVYRLQDLTGEIVAALRAVAPDRGVNADFLAIVRAGTGKEWQQEHNAAWAEVTRPIVEAFLHARYFLSMAVRYAEELSIAPALMPSGWAAVLCLYGLR